MDLRSLLTEPENVALPFAIVFVTYVIRQGAAPFFRSARGQRLLPALPLLLGLGFALGGIGTAGPWRDRVLFGILAGMTASAGFKFVRTTVWGKGIADALDPEKPADTPEAPAQAPQEPAKAPEAVSGAKGAAKGAEGPTEAQVGPGAQGGGAA